MRSNSKPNTYCGNLASARIAWFVIVFGRSSEMYRNGNDASVSTSAISCDFQLCLTMNRQIVGSRSGDTVPGSAAAVSARFQRGRRNQPEAGAASEGGAAAGTTAGAAGGATAAIVF